MYRYLRRDVATRTIAVLVITMLVVFAGSVQPLWADVDEPVVCCGGDGTEADRVPDSPAEHGQAKAKLAIADAAVAYWNGTGSNEDYEAAVRAYEAAYPDSAPFRPVTGTPQPQATKLLNLWQVGQETNIWCGPATAFMMVYSLYHYGNVDKTSSHVPSGYSLNQSNLAKPQWLDAVNDGTKRADMRDGINAWIGSGFYVVIDQPTLDEFQNALISDVNFNYSMAVATLEYATHEHYNGHPVNKQVDHWVPAYGYYDNAQTTRFADSSTSLWPTVSRYFNYDTRTFVSRWVQGQKAIVW